MVVLAFVCLACTLAGLAYGFVAYCEVSEIRDENYALKQDEYAARERCDKLTREVEYVHTRLATVRDKYICLEDETNDLRAEMANIQASLKTNAKKRTVEEWLKLVGEITC